MVCAEQLVADFFNEKLVSADKPLLQVPQELAQQTFPARSVKTEGDLAAALGEWHAAVFTFDGS